MAEQRVRNGLTSTEKLRLVVLGALLIVLGGTFGFMLIERMSFLEALYMTIITLSTVGFGEITPLHPAGRVFVIILISLGVVTVGSFAALLGEQILEGHFRNLVTRRKMENKLKKMKDHYIVAGFGRVGRQVAKEIMERNAPCVVIEKDEASLEKIADEGLVAVTGDATDDDVLLRAGVERARTLISTLPEEAQNVYLTLTARHMNSGLNIIARADFEEGEKKLLRAGANHVVIPHILGGIRMAKAALQPHVVDFMQMASLGEEGLLVEELVIPEDSLLVGHTLADSNLKQRYGITVIGIKHPGQKMNINPRAETSLAADDVVVVIGAIEDLERFSRDISS
jgi:voltage-gated potassium channel